MAEMIIEVDENDTKIGLRPRDDFYTGNYIHRSAHLILFNSKNEILIQLRSHNKKWFPDLFTYSVSGTVADESYEACIAREMKEELGISIDVKRLFKHRPFDLLDDAWHCVFIGKYDGQITPDKGEMKKVNWISADELKDDIIKNLDIYTPPFAAGMKIFFNRFYKEIFE